MNKNLQLLEEMLELDEGTLKEDMLLEDIDEWDSMAALSFIVLLDEEFHKKMTGKEIRAFKTVGDLTAVMKE